MMTDVVVVDESYTYVTREASGEQWDGEDTVTDHSIQGIKQAVMYSDLTVGFELEEGKTYHLLYAIYGTGNSFGREEGKIEFVGLYEDEKVAKENERRINQHSKNEHALNGRYTIEKISAKEMRKIEKTHQSFSVELITEDGQEYLQHVPWHGYFESLESVDIEAVTLI